MNNNRSQFTHEALTVILFSLSKLIYACETQRATVVLLHCQCDDDDDDEIRRDLFPFTHSNCQRCRVRERAKYFVVLNVKYHKIKKRAKFFFNVHDSARYSSSVCRAGAMMGRIR